MSQSPRSDATKAALSTLVGLGTLASVTTMAKFGLVDLSGLEAHSAKRRALLTVGAAAGRCRCRQ